ncbi:MAG: DUF86 domain-containing protein [Chloroflexi bacterium]|nr:DUF86 domain-containing protein [Chloroflexota bacterium]
MSRDAAYLLDILEAARLACQYAAGKDVSAFVADTQCQDAVIRRLEIMGEAARRLSAEKRAELANLPWDMMTDMRNLLIHEYDGVDLTIVWDTVQFDLPPLIAQLEAILADDSRP